MAGKRYENCEVCKGKFLKVTLSYKKEITRSNMKNLMIKRRSYLKGNADIFKLIVILFAIYLLFFTSPLYAGVYYVDDNGKAFWAACEHNAGTPGPKSGNNACNLATANANVAPGDIVYLREGTYYPTNSSTCIHPGKSGTAENRIVYINYNGESVMIDGTNSDEPGILFSKGWFSGNRDDGRSYITVKGISFANFKKLADFYYASYNEIANCNFLGHKNNGIGCLYISCSLMYESSHNWFHGNTWHTFGHFVDADVGCLISIGHDNTGNSDNSGNDYNTIEDNHFYSGGHHVIGVNNGKFNVIRNNYFHNEGWSTAGACTSRTTGVCGYNVMSMTDVAGSNYSGTNLLEDNNIAYGAQYGGPHLVGGCSGMGLTVHTDSNVVRYNNFFGNVAMSIRLGSSITGGTAFGNHIYNNTIYYTGYNLDSWGVINEDDTKLYDNYRCSIRFYGTGGACAVNIENNIIKNNLIHDTWSETNHIKNSIYYPAIIIEDAAACNTITNNWGNTGTSQSRPYTAYPDPKFVDPDIANPMALAFVNGRWVGKPDLSLQDISPVIDKGAPLTQANGSSGSNPITTLCVDDARYFQDGKWGSNLARATLQADVIAIGTVSKKVKIKSINYGAKTIELDSPMTWLDDAPIWLYKKSNGDVVLYGNASDYGAHEYRSLPKLIGLRLKRKNN